MWNLAVYTFSTPEISWGRSYVRPACTISRSDEFSPHLERGHGGVLVDTQLNHVQKVVVEEAAQHKVIGPLLVVRRQREQSAAMESTTWGVQAGGQRTTPRVRHLTVPLAGYQSFLLEKNSSDAASSKGRIGLRRWKSTASAFLSEYLDGRRRRKGRNHRPSGHSLTRRQGPYLPDHVRDRAATRSRRPTCGGHAGKAPSWHSQSLWAREPRVRAWRGASWES